MQDFDPKTLFFYDSLHTYIIHFFLLFKQVSFWYKRHVNPLHVDRFVSSPKEKGQR